MYQRFQADQDVEPTLMGGNNADVGSSTGHFKNSAEMQAVMNSKEYKADPKIQAEVARKIAASQKLGIDLFK